MTNTRFFDLPLSMIDIPEARARDLDVVWATALADIIRVQGLTNPITVRHVGDRYELIAGMHRLEALRILGADEIPCHLSSADSEDEARLEEVMENLGRAELIALDRCHHLYELKQVWERMYPETGHGKASPKTPSWHLSSKPQEIFGFAAANAEKVGLSKRTIQRAVGVWTGLAPASRARLIGTDLAKKQTELQALSDQSPVRQQRILDLILDPNQEVTNVAGALNAMSGGSVTNDLERTLATMRSKLSKLPDEALDRLVDEQAERVIASLKRMGRI